MYNLKNPTVEHFNYVVVAEKNEDIIENFDIGNLAEKNNETDAAWPKQDDASTTYQFRCYKKAMNVVSFSATGAASSMGYPEQQNNFAPKEGTSEFGPYNPIWLMIPVLNLALNIFFDLFEIFTWLFIHIFQDVYKELVPKNMLAGTGIRPGKKYCFGMGWFRHLVTFTCPPAGVFMAYGIRGWLQILICCVGSLLYYFPGLAYALIVINRSEVAELIKQRESNDCNSDSLSGFFYSSEGDGQPECSRDIGESCDPEGRPMPEDKNKLSCCANPIAQTDSEGKTTYTVLGSTATDSNGNEIESGSEGRRYCRKDTKEVKQEKGICVWESTDKPN